MDEVLAGLYGDLFRPVEEYLGEPADLELTFRGIVVVHAGAHPKRG